MKLILNFIFLVLTAITCFARETSIDSLKRKLLAEETDSNKVYLLRRIAFELVNSRPDSALVFARQGYLLAQKIDFEKGEAECLNLIGTTFLKRGNYPKALEYRYRTLKIYERLRSNRDLILINNNIGNIFNETGNSREALSYYFKALQISKEHNLKEDRAMVLCNIGDEYEKMNVIDSARIYTHSAYELSEELHDKAGRGILLCNLGNIHSKMKEEQIALGYYRLSLPELTESNNDEGVCEAAMGMANLFQRIGQFDSALYYSRLSFVTAKHGGFTKPLFVASGFMSQFFKHTNKPDSALFYLTLSIAAKDSMFSQEKNRQLQNLMFAELIRQQEIDQAAKLAEQERKNNLQMTGIAAFIPGFFVFILFLRKRKANRKTIEFLSLLGVLLLFEFISLLIHPSIGKLTHHTPVFMLVILVAVASLLVPLHHRTASWVKKKLSDRPISASQVEEVPVAENSNS